LGKKPDALTRKWDVYGDDPLKNLLAQRPVFAQTQLTSSIMDLDSQPLTLQAATVTNLQSLISDIKEVSQKVTYLFCDELKIVSKELMSRVRQATKDVVKSEV